MQTTVNPFKGQAASLSALLLTALLLLAGCSGATTGSGSAVDLDPFKELARKAGCADTRNRLFLIDDQIVFWETAGNCADAAYSQTLYGSTPDQVLCSFHDSIAGPMKDCPDESYEALFDGILANLDSPDLGLGPSHTVEAVPF